MQVKLFLSLLIWTTDCMQLLSESHLHGCQIFERFGYFISDSELNFGFPCTPSVMHLPCSGLILFFLFIFYFYLLCLFLSLYDVIMFGATELRWQIYGFDLIWCRLWWCDWRWVTLVQVMCVKVCTLEWWWWWWCVGRSCGDDEHSGELLTHWASALWSVRQCDWYQCWCKFCSCSPTVHSCDMILSSCC